MHPVTDSHPDQSAGRLRRRIAASIAGLMLGASLIAAPPPTATAADFASDVVAVANAEDATYGGQHECNDAPLSARIGTYWSALGLSLDGCNRDVPWSAAFVSYMVNAAGGGDQFRYSSAHRVYIHDAFAGGRGLYGSVANADTASPKPGDLVCSGRGRVGSWGYQDFVNWYNAGGINHDAIPTHCDIVVSTNGNQITVVGGNVGQSVTRATTDKSTYAIVLPVTGGDNPVGTGQIVGHGGQCLDLPYQNTANGTDLWMWSCNGTAAQQWTIDNGEIRVMGKCLDIEGTEQEGSDVQITLCGYTGNLQWYVTGAGEIKSERFPALCLDVRGAGTTPGTLVQMWNCNGSSAQRWTVPG